MSSSSSSSTASSVTSRRRGGGDAAPEDVSPTGKESVAVARIMEDDEELSRQIEAMSTTSGSSSGSAHKSGGKLGALMNTLFAPSGATGLEVGTVAEVRCASCDALEGPSSSTSSSTFKKCGRCGDVHYCCKEHQVSHWSVHKKFCVPRSAEAVALVALGGKKKLPRKQQETSVLNLAVMSNDSSLVMQLLRTGEDVNRRGTFGFTPLIEACENNNLSLVKTLLEYNAGVDVPDSHTGNRPLYHACFFGNFEIAKLLLKKGAKVNAKSNEGISALLVAAQNGHVDTCTLLLNAKANIDDRSHAGDSALYIAAQGGKDKVVELLLSRGANANIVEGDGSSALHSASQEGSLASVIALCNHHADLNILNNTNTSALGLACYFARTEIVRELLKRGANTNIGDPAIICACDSINQEDIDEVAGGSVSQFWANRFECVKLLVAAGANLFVLDPMRRSPLILALSNKQQAMADFLAQHMKRIADIAKRGLISEGAVEEAEGGEEGRGGEVEEEGGEEEKEEGASSSNGGSK